MIVKQVYINLTSQSIWEAYRNLIAKLIYEHKNDLTHNNFFKALVIDRNRFKHKSELKNNSLKSESLT